MMFLWIIIIGLLLFMLFGENIKLNNNSPQNHADERLAKGEISIHEYQDIIATLKENKK